MSDRFEKPRPPDPANSESSRGPPPRAGDPLSAAPRYGPSAHGSSNLSPALPRQPSGNVRNAELPSLSQAPRPNAFSVILNPTDPDEHSQTFRRRASQLPSPSLTYNVLPPLGQSAQKPPATTGFAMPSPLAPSTAGREGPPRRILTPRSPSLHRSASLNQLNPPTATINAQQSPFPGSPRIRTYTVEPGTAGAPPLPTLSAAARQSYGYPGPGSGAQSVRRVSSGVGPISESTSPRSSYSPYSQAERASPGTQSHGNDPYYPVSVPISSSGGQSVYQMMTLETTSGSVQLPVDVQAASRVADEKRKRNAGASARFRQRRKEKEKESTTTISKLEQELKEVCDDMDFYKRERDYLAGVVRQVPGGAIHFPRPVSPRHRRTSNPVSRSTGRHSSFASVPESMPRNPDEGRNVRRRTSTLSLAPPTAQAPLSGPPGPIQPSYPSQMYAQPLPPQSQLHHQHPPPPPPQHQHQQQHRPQNTLPSPAGMGSLPRPMPGPLQLLQAAPQTGPWNPYASDRRPPGEPGRDRDEKQQQQQQR